MPNTLETTEKTCFLLRFSDRIQSRPLRLLARAGEAVIENIFGLQSFERDFRRLLKDDREIPFVEKILDFMGIYINIREEDLEQIPAHGPVVVVANHPFGGIEGVILAYILDRRRPDAKILANFILGRIVELRPHFIFVDPFENTSAVKKNISPLRAAASYLKKGGLIAAFPSGTVSHFDWDKKQILDPEWNPNIGALARRGKAHVVPVFFSGRNGNFFQLAGLIHPILRTMLLPREFRNKSTRTISVHIGSPITPEKIASFGDDQELTTYLRLRTYILGSREGVKASRSNFLGIEQGPTLEKIIPPVQPEKVALEVAELPRTQLLYEKGKYQVFFAQAQQIPYTLREIGRLREVTFRDAREGSGKSLDIDRFDNYYKHLFLWHKEALEIVGAYRLIEADTVVARYGVRGLYTHTLFDYGPELISQMGPALELGRSFVRKEYQRDIFSLQYLWTGIARYVLRDLRYKILFGTVSISSEYDSVSRKLIMSFLQGNRFTSDLANFIKPRNPFSAKALTGVDAESTGRVVKDIRDISELLKEIEAKHHHIPVLLKQYLKLGGKIIGFNTDTKFGNVLDGLVYVDITETDERSFGRYIGKEGFKQLMEFHKKTTSDDLSGT